MRRLISVAVAGTAAAAVVGIPSAAPAADEHAAAATTISRYYTHGRNARASGTVFWRKGSTRVRYRLVNGAAIRWPCAQIYFAVFDRNDTLLQDHRVGPGRDQRACLRAEPGNPNVPRTFTGSVTLVPAGGGTLRIGLLVGSPDLDQPDHGPVVSVLDCSPTQRRCTQISGTLPAVGP